MSDALNVTKGLSDPDRRELLRTAGAAAIGGLAVTAAISSPAFAQKCRQLEPERRQGGPQ